MSKKAPPKYILHITDKKNTKNKTRAGALFENELGFFLVLNPGVSIDYEMQEKYWLSFKENTPYDQNYRSSESGDTEAPASDGDVPIK